jgi:acyl-CoA reductase-like NAD-dependent aldehyde dehydrogenase
MRRSEVVALVASSGAEDVDAAVAAARASFPSWATLPMAKRASHLIGTADALEKRAKETACDMAAEMGKPLRETRGEVGRGLQILRYAASETYRPVGESFEQAATGAQVSTRHRALGAVALIAPWNFPCAIPVWKLAPALIYGYTAVLKLAHASLLTRLHVAAAFAEAGLPAGVLNVLTGSGSVIGAALVRDPRIRAVSLTGSLETGS